MRISSLSLIAIVILIASCTKQREQVLQIQNLTDRVIRIENTSFSNAQATNPVELQPVQYTILLTQVVNNPDGDSDCPVSLGEGVRFSVYDGLDTFLVDSLLLTLPIEQSTVAQGARRTERFTCTIIYE